MVSVVDVLRGDEEAPGWRDNLNRLPASRAELKVNPVVRKERIDSLLLNAGNIGTIVSVKVCNRKRRDQFD